MWKLREMDQGWCENSTAVMSQASSVLLLCHLQPGFCLVTHDGCSSCCMMSLFQLWQKGQGNGRHSFILRAQHRSTKVVPWLAVQLNILLLHIRGEQVLGDTEPACHWCLLCLFAILTPKKIYVFPEVKLESLKMTSVDLRVLRSNVLSWHSRKWEEKGHDTERAELYTMKPFKIWEDFGSELSATNTKKETICLLHVQTHIHLLTVGFVSFSKKRVEFQVFT